MTVILLGRGPTFKRGVNSRLCGQLQGHPPRGGQGRCIFGPAGRGAKPPPSSQLASAKPGIAMSGAGGGTDGGGAPSRARRDDEAVRLPRRPRRCLVDARARLVPRAPRRERRRQEHPRQVRDGLLRARQGRGDRRRRRVRHPEPSRRARPPDRDGVPAFHAGAEHDGGRELLAGARGPLPRRRLGRRAPPVARVLEGHAVHGRSRGGGRLAGGRRETEGRDPQAALPGLARPDPRRADVGAHARRG